MDKIGPTIEKEYCILRLEVYWNKRTALVVKIVWIESLIWVDGDNQIPYQKFVDSLNCYKSMKK